MPAEAGTSNFLYTKNTIITMQPVGTARIVKGKKVQILSDAVKKLGWQDGDMLMEFVDAKKKCLCIRKVDDVIGEAKENER